MQQELENFLTESQLCAIDESNSSSLEDEIEVAIDDPCPDILDDYNSEIASDDADLS